MAQVIAAVLGWGVLLFGAGALALAVGRRASAHGILAPLVVGICLRLVVMLIAHAGSLFLGDHGILFLDDQTYLHDGTLLADLWRDGHTPDPARYDVLGTYQLGYQSFVGLIFTLGTSSILLGKLANVLIGGLTVFIVARIAGRLLGEQAQVRAAWLAALAPSLVWWSAPLMKEALATMLLALGVLALTALPRPRALGTFGAVLAALMVVRIPAALALVVGAGLAIALAGRGAERRWLLRPLIVFATTLIGGLTAVALVLSQGDLLSFYNQYQFTVQQMFNQYQGANLANWPLDAAKSLVTPLPWVFDSGTRNWDRGLYPGVWLLLCAYPLAAVGVWRLRRRPEVGVLVATAVTALAVDALTTGFVFRQRSMIEPLVLLLALAGTPSWQVAGRFASAALVAVAVVAGVQSRSLAVALVVSAAAGCLVLATRRLPPNPFEPFPDSPMVAAFRESFRPTRSLGASASSRRVGEVAGLFRTIGAAAAALRKALVHAAPLLEADRTLGESGPVLSDWQRDPVGTATLQTLAPIGSLDHAIMPGSPSVSRRVSGKFASAALATVAVIVDPQTRSRRVGEVAGLFRTIGAAAAALRKALVHAAPLLEADRTLGESGPVLSDWQRDPVGTATLQTLAPIGSLDHAIMPGSPSVSRRVSGKFASAALATVAVIVDPQTRSRRVGEVAGLFRTIGAAAAALRKALVHAAPLLEADRTLGESGPVLSDWQRDPVGTATLQTLAPIGSLDHAIMPGSPSVSRRVSGKFASAALATVAVIVDPQTRSRRVGEVAGLFRTIGAAAAALRKALVHAAPLLEADRTLGESGPVLSDWQRDPVGTATLQTLAPIGSLDHAIMPGSPSVSRRVSGKFASAALATVAVIVDPQTRSRRVGEVAGLFRTIGAAAAALRKALVHAAPLLEADRTLGESGPVLSDWQRDPVGTATLQTLAPIGSLDHAIMPGSPSVSRRVSGKFASAALATVAVIVDPQTRSRRVGEVAGLFRTIGAAAAALRKALVHAAPLLEADRTLGESGPVLSDWQRDPVGTATLQTLAPIGSLDHAIMPGSPSVSRRVSGKFASAALATVAVIVDPQTRSRRFGEVAGLFRTIGAAAAALRKALVHAAPLLEADRTLGESGPVLSDWHRDPVGTATLQTLAPIGSLDHAIMPGSPSVSRRVSGKFASAALATVAVIVDPQTRSRRFGEVAGLFRTIGAAAAALRKALVHAAPLLEADRTLGESGPVLSDWHRDPVGTATLQTLAPIGSLDHAIMPGSPSARSCDTLHRLRRFAPAIEPPLSGSTRATKGHPRMRARDERHS